jgi:alkylhydroperoxidase/carboxymuconolactone decarboxylase family protein YurZ
MREDEPSERRRAECVTAAPSCPHLLVFGAKASVCADPTLAAARSNRAAIVVVRVQGPLHRAPGRRASDAQSVQMTISVLRSGGRGSAEPTVSRSQGDGHSSATKPGPDTKKCDAAAPSSRQGVSAAWTWLIARRVPTSSAPRATGATTADPLVRRARGVDLPRAPDSHPEPEAADHPIVTMRRSGQTRDDRPRRSANRKDPMATDPSETPVLDTLAAMTVESVARTGLDANSLLAVRIAALVAVDAPVASYLMHVGPAMDAGVTIEQVQDILVAVAPIVGSPRTMSAAAKITEALGVVVIAAEEELGAEQG